MAVQSIPALFAQRVIVGVGDMGASNNPLITLSTYALGSCVAVVVYDPVARAGGLLHLMLPDSKISPDKAAAQPAMFADTGMPLLFKALAGLKCNPMHYRIFLAGGASVLCGNDNFKIGERNIQATGAILARMRFSARYTAIGGTSNRTVHLNVATGAITMKMPNGEDRFTLGD